MVGFERQAAWAQARRPGSSRSSRGAARVMTLRWPGPIGPARRARTPRTRWAWRYTCPGGRRPAGSRSPGNWSSGCRRPWMLWQAGRLDERRVTAICDATRHLPLDTARAVQARVLPRAPEQTLSQLRAALARAVIAADPEGAERRHHVVPFPIGPTTEPNLAGYCGHDHHAKHAPGWRVRAMTTAGSSGSPRPGTATPASRSTTGSTTTRSRSRPDRNDHRHHHHRPTITARRGHGRRGTTPVLNSPVVWGGAGSVTAPDRAQPRARRCGRSRPRACRRTAAVQRRGPASLARTMHPASALRIIGTP